MTRVSALVFDRDGVLITLDRQRFQREVLARIPLSPDTLASRWEAWTAGAPLCDALDEEEAIRSFLETLGAAFGLAPDARHWLTSLDYTAHVRCYDDAREALHEGRRRGLRVGVLTNNSMGVSPGRMLAAAGLEGLVDVAVSAQMIGARKPAPAAYAAIAAALGMSPERCLFFDDRPASVAGARAVGMAAYQVDRSRSEHDVAAGVLKDLSALPSILDQLSG